MERSMYAGRVRSEHIGTTITLKGWVSRRRNLGGLIFIDLRDREGLMQLVVNPENADANVVETAESLRSEFVIEVTGTVEAREQANDNLPTGAVELKVFQHLWTTKIQVAVTHTCIITSLNTIFDFKWCCFGSIKDFKVFNFKFDSTCRQVIISLFTPSVIILMTRNLSMLKHQC